MSSGAAATRSEVDETPYCEDEGGGGGLSPCNPEDDCFANCRTHIKMWVNWSKKSHQWSSQEIVGGD